MSDKVPKKTTFLTEDGQQQAEAPTAEAEADQPQVPENRESSGVAETTESEANNNDEEEEEQEEEASDDDYVDYVNPFYPQYSHTQPTTDSDKEKNQSSDNADEEEQSSGDVRPISAVAPKVLQQDETQVEISSTPAFQCLEEVSS